MDDFAERLKLLAAEGEKFRANLAKPIASVDVSREGRAINICLDGSKNTYNEWIKGEGGDIGLDRDRDTGKVNGARLPLYAKTLLVQGDWGTIVIDLDSGNVTSCPIPVASALNTV